MNFRNDIFSAAAPQQQNTTILDNKVNNLHARLQKVETYLNNVVKGNNNGGFNNIHNPDLNNVHYGINCNQCGKKNIIGIRYKCGHCGWNVCSKCEKKLYKTHNPNHLFIRIHNPNLAHIVDRK